MEISEWQDQLADCLHSAWFGNLANFIQSEYASAQIYPPRNQIFNALEVTPYSKVKVVLLGQDPYHRRGQAHGLSFSVNDGVALPPSLRNIFKELFNDLGYPPDQNGNLLPWAEQGVLLLNTILTVREGHPLSHRDRGWEIFTDQILLKLASRRVPIVFILWGNHARKKKDLLQKESTAGVKHLFIEAAHPSPLAAHHGFFGSKPFSRTNSFLESVGHEPINWRRS